MKYTPVPNDQYTDKMAKRDKRVINKAIKEAMSNSTQNDHETHTACIDRIMKEGAGAACCYCSPHKGCTLYVKPSTQNDYEHDYVVDIVNIVGVTIDASQYKKIDKILADARKAERDICRKVYVRNAAFAEYGISDEKAGKEFDKVFQELL